jgi:hypothetical protein
MSHPHAINGDIHVDVLNLNHEDHLPSIISSSPETEYAVDPVMVSTREVAKSVKLSAGKRRKVVPDDASTPTGPRKTRFGAGNPPVQNTVKSAGLKRRITEESKTATKAAQQKRLQETFERHDTKVRELFHLTKFVTLVDYDPKIAKEDESEVFKEVPILNMLSNWTVQSAV